MIRAIISALALASLAACGGGGGGDPATPEKPAAAAACASPRVVSIQLFGDSTQYGFDGGTRKQATTTPAKALQADLDEDFGPGAVIVSARAISGTTSTQLLTGTDGLNQPWPANVAADIVLMNHGINDGYAKTPLANYAQTLRTLYRASPATLIFETPITPTRAGIDWNIPAYAQTMRDVGRELGALVIDTAAVRVTLPDGIHPDAAGYQLIADKAVAPGLRDLVAAKQCGGVL